MINLASEKDIPVKAVHRAPNKINPKRCRPRHIIIKMSSVMEKKKVLKATKESQILKRAPIRQSTDFSNKHFK